MRGSFWGPGPLGREKRVASFLDVWGNGATLRDRSYFAQMDAVHTRGKT